MEFMHLQPHAQMPVDDATIDYRYDLLDRIFVYNVDCHTAAMVAAVTVHTESLTCT